MHTKSAQYSRGPVMLAQQDSILGSFPSPLSANPPPGDISPPPVPVIAVGPAARKEPWRANASRKDLPKRNLGEAAIAARAAKAYAATAKAQASTSSLQLPNFPVPGQVVRCGSVKSNADSAWTSTLSQTASTSVLQLSNFNEFGRPPSTKAPSIRTTASAKVVSSLGEGVGFTFKATCNFVHPNRQLPRSNNRLSMRSSVRSSARSVNLYQEETETAMAQRMNSVTSDGGWKSHWSVSGSSRLSLDAGSGAERPVSIHSDVAPDEILARDDKSDAIPEEQEDPVCGSLRSSRSSQLSPTTRSRKSSLSIRLRHEDSDPTTPPSRSSLDRALGLLIKEAEPEDANDRASKIQAARKAFNEKEAAKDRKWAEQEAKKEEKRRRSETPSNRTATWVHRPSNAADALERSSSWVRRSSSVLDTPACTSSQARGPSNPVDSPVESLAESPHSLKLSLSTSHRSKFLEDDAPGGPLDRTASAEDAAFPAYCEVSEGRRPVFAPVFEEPAVIQPSKVHGQFYQVDSTWYDEYGAEVPLEKQKTLQSEQSRRSLSVTKQAKGRMSKLTAWGKTRMLRA